MVWLPSTEISGVHAARTSSLQEGIDHRSRTTTDKKLWRTNNCITGRPANRPFRVVADGAVRLCRTSKVLDRGSSLGVPCTLVPVVLLCHISCMLRASCIPHSAIIDGHTRSREGQYCRSASIKQQCKGNALPRRSHPVCWRLDRDMDLFCRLS